MSCLQLQLLMDSGHAKLDQWLLFNSLGQEGSWSKNTLGEF